MNENTILSRHLARRRRTLRLVRMRRALGRVCRRCLAFLGAQKYLLSIIILDLLLMLLIVLPLIREIQWLTTDTYRDITYAQGILNGNPFFADPTIKGEYMWYPPLNPMLFALLSKITGIDLFRLYAYSPLFIHIFIPIAFYFFVLALFRKKEVAFLAVLLIPIMPWVISHFFYIVSPSTHTFVIIIPMLTHLINSERRGFKLRNSILIGVLGGVAFMNHSLSALIAYGGMFLFLLINQFFRKKGYRWRDLLLMLGIPVLCWAPYMIPNLFRTKLNWEPLHFLSDIILNPEFALYMPNKYTFGVTLAFLAVGLWLSLKAVKKDHAPLLLHYLVGIAFIGQMLGYLQFLADAFPQTVGWLARLPFLIPHEFQWWFQIFSLPLIAYGMVRVVQLYSRKLWYLLLCLLLIGGYLTEPYLKLPVHVPRMIEGGAWTKEKAPAFTDWINENTPPDSVILTSNTVMAYFFVQPYTARKVVNSFAGHTNFNVDLDARNEDVRTMLFDADRELFLQLAEKYEVDYLAIQHGDLPPERMEFLDNNFLETYDDNWIAVYDIELPPEDSGPAD